VIAPAPPPAPPARVLIIKPSALGDVVTATCVLRGLKRRFAHAHVAWLVNRQYAGLLEHDTDVDEVIPFDRALVGRPWRPGAVSAFRRLAAALRGGRFDWAIDLQGLFRSGCLARLTRAPVRAGFADAREGAGLFYTHRIDVAAVHTVDRNIELARRLGVDCSREDVTLQVSAEGERFAAGFLAEQGLAAGGFLVAVPPTRWRTKLYPVRHWRRVTAAMAERLPVVLLGTSADRPLCAAISDGLPPGVVNAAGRTTVPQMVALVAAAAGVVCCDSAAKFIAPAVGVPAVVLTGPTRVERTGPLAGGRAVVAEVPCQGCLKRRCRHVTCMEMIPPDEVISAAGRMLDRRSR
jgi:ADP-heptose:LPS heptosyltransferase